MSFNRVEIKYLRQIIIFFVETIFLSMETHAFQNTCFNSFLSTVMNNRALYEKVLATQEVCSAKLLTA